MPTPLAKYTVIAFGVYIFAVGFLMLFKPKKAHWLLRQAGSTNLINYAEITIRLIPAVALILHADYAKAPLPFFAFGWIMVITSAVLYVIPRAWHHRFSLTAAEVLTPFRFQLAAPFAFLIGAAIVWNAW